MKCRTLPFLQQINSVSLLDSTNEGFVFCHCSVYTLQNIYPILFDYFTFFMSGRNQLNKKMSNIFKKFQE
jgi:hypothetical protein